MRNDSEVVFWPLNMCTFTSYTYMYMHTYTDTQMHTRGKFTESH